MVIPFGMRVTLVEWQTSVTPENHSTNLTDAGDRFVGWRHLTGTIVTCTCIRCCARHNHARLSFHINTHLNRKHYCYKSVDLPNFHSLLTSTGDGFVCHVPSTQQMFVVDSCPCLSHRFVVLPCPAKSFKVLQHMFTITQSVLCTENISNIVVVSRLVMKTMTCHTVGVWYCLWHLNQFQWHYPVAACSPSPSMCTRVYDPYFALCPGVSHRASPASVAVPPSFNSRGVPSLSSSHTSLITPFDNGQTPAAWKNSRPKQAAISATLECVSPVKSIAAEISIFPIGTFFISGWDCHAYVWPPWH